MRTVTSAKVGTRRGSISGIASASLRPKGRPLPCSSSARLRRALSKYLTQFRSCYSLTPPSPTSPDFSVDPHRSRVAPQCDRPTIAVERSPELATVLPELLGRTERDPPIP